MLPYVCPVIDHRWGQNVERTKKWHTGAAECVTNALTTFWRLLWSIYTHVIIECFGFTRYQEKMLLTVTSSIRLSFNRSQLRTNQSYVYNCVSWFPFNENPKFPRICHHVSLFHASAFQAFVARNFTCEPHLWIVSTSYHQLHPWGTEFFCNLILMKKNK